MVEVEVGMMREMMVGSIVTTTMTWISDQTLVVPHLALVGTGVWIQMELLFLVTVKVLMMAYWPPQPRGKLLVSS